MQFHIAILGLLPVVLASPMPLSQGGNATQSSMSAAAASGVKAAVSKAGAALASATPTITTQQYLGPNGSSVNWGTAGPGPALDWLQTQCPSLECTGSYTWTQGNWPAPITGQSEGHVVLDVVTNGMKADRLPTYIAAMKAYFGSNETNTTVHWDPSATDPSPHGPVGPLPSMTVIATPSYFGLRRCVPSPDDPGDGACAITVDEMSVQATYVNDDGIAQFICSTALSLVGMLNPWVGFFENIASQPLCGAL